MSLRCMEYAKTIIKSSNDFYYQNRASKYCDPTVELSKLPHNYTFISRTCYVDKIIVKSDNLKKFLKQILLWLSKWLWIPFREMMKKELRLMIVYNYVNSISVRAYMCTLILNKNIKNVCINAHIQINLGVNSLNNDIIILKYSNIKADKMMNVFRCRQTTLHAFGEHVIAIHLSKKQSQNASTTIL